MIDAPALVARSWRGFLQHISTSLVFLHFDLAFSACIFSLTAGRIYEIKYLLCLVAPERNILWRFYFSSLLFLVRRLAVSKNFILVIRFDEQNNQTRPMPYN
jgi:hypothetical protein